MFPSTAVFDLGRYDVSARYCASQPSTTMGGDWYDAQFGPDGSAVVVLGDVAGHGSRAAASLMRIENALHGLTMSGQAPGSLLGCLNQLVCSDECPERVASAVVCVLDQDRPALHWAQAGHLPPVLACRGAARLLGRPPGLLLGIDPAARYDLGHQDLLAGDILFLYTDGLVERRGMDIKDGLDALLAAAAGENGKTAAEAVEAVRGRLALPPGDDDMCLIAIRVSR